MLFLFNCFLKEFNILLKSASFFLSDFLKVANTLLYLFNLSFKTLSYLFVLCSFCICHLVLLSEIPVFLLDNYVFPLISLDFIMHWLHLALILIKPRANTENLLLRSLQTSFLLIHCETSFRRNILVGLLTSCWTTLRMRVSTSSCRGRL